MDLPRIFNDHTLLGNTIAKYLLKRSETFNTLNPFRQASQRWPRGYKTTSIKLPGGGGGGTAVFWNNIFWTEFA